MKAKILVIDPSVTIQKVIGIMLSDGPYEAVQCTTQEEYAKSKDQGPYDLIVLDYRFADNFIAQVKQDFATAKILAMLGTFDQKDEGELLNQGADDCIVRPFESGKFLDKCNKLLQDRPASAEVATPTPEDNNPHFDPLPESSAAEGEEEDLALGESSSPTISIEAQKNENESSINLQAIESTPADDSVAQAGADADTANSSEAMANEEKDNVGGQAEDTNAIMANLSTEDEAFAEMDQPAAVQDEAFAELPAAQGEGRSSLDDTLSGWSVNAPTIQPAAEEPPAKLGDDALAQAVAGWGMSVPDVIEENPASSSSAQEFSGEIPGVIGEEAAGDALPAQQDLAYPDEGGGKSSAEILSKLVPMENLDNGDDGEDFEDADRTVAMEIAPDLLKNDGLEEEIAQELAAEEFWSPEEEGKETKDGKESEDKLAAASAAVTKTTEKATEGPTSSTAIADVGGASSAEHLTPQLLAEIKQAISPVDKDALLEEVKQALPSLAAGQMGSQLQNILRPEIDKMVQEYCQKTIEHVAWEIIPDLAENLIKQHLKTIAEEAKQSF